jgi:transposase
MVQNFGAGCAPTAFKAAFASSETVQHANAVPSGAGKSTSACQIARLLTMGRDHLSKADAIQIERIEAALLCSFARGFRRDKAAVIAALREPWSNGQTEGQINRLKALKRQMYGPANIDLLKARLVAAC